jgi:hypothetical protein
MLIFLRTLPAWSASPRKLALSEAPSSAYIWLATTFANP